MKLSRIWAFGLATALPLAGLGTVGAAALDAPHTLHRARTAEPHLADSHRRHAAAHAATHAGTSGARLYALVREVERLFQTYQYGEAGRADLRVLLE